MKTVNVVAAIIIKDDKVFATQRGYGEFKDGWEFPGGKVEPQETPEEYDYPTFHLSMQCFICSVISGSLTLLEHENAKWLTREELYSVSWLPADIKVVEALQNNTLIL